MTPNQIQIENIQRLIRITDQRGLKVTKQLYDEAIAVLEAKLRRVAKAEPSLSILTHKSFLAQLKAAQAELTKKLIASTASATTHVQAEAADSAIHLLNAFESRKGGNLPVLALEEASHFLGITQKRRPSLLASQAEVLTASADITAKKVQRELALSLASGQTSDEAITRVMDALGSDYYRAERIVRTELSWAYNATHADAIEDAQGEIPDLMQRWVELVDDTTGAPYDNRVAPDSIAMHGQLAIPGGQFTMPSAARVDSRLVGKSWSSPPNRPNDRATLSPWRPHWGIPGWAQRGGVRVPVTEQNYHEVFPGVQKREEPVAEVVSSPAPPQLERVIAPPPPPIAALPKPAPAPVVATPAPKPVAATGPRYVWEAPPATMEEHHDRLKSVLGELYGSELGDSRAVLDSKEVVKGTAAHRDWDGTVHYSERTSNGLRSALTQTGELSEAEMRSLAVAHHEHMHGLGVYKKATLPGQLKNNLSDAYAYDANGATLEEGVVELTAMRDYREVAKRMGYKVPADPAVGKFRIWQADGTLEVEHAYVPEVGLVEQIIKASHGLPKEASIEGAAYEMQMDLLHRWKPTERVGKLVDVLIQSGPQDGTVKDAKGKWEWDSLGYNKDRALRFYFGPAIKKQATADEMRAYLDKIVHAKDSDEVKAIADKMGIDIT